MVLPALYWPFLSTLVWAEAAGQPDFLLQDGAERAIIIRKKRAIRCFMS